MTYDKITLPGITTQPRPSQLLLKTTASHTNIPDPRRRAFVLRSALDCVGRTDGLRGVEKRMTSEVEGWRRVVFFATADGTGFVSPLSSQAQSLADW